MKKIISLILIMFSILIITSCNSDTPMPNLIVSGDFRYKLVMGDRAIIMSFSNEGKTKKIITIPDYIDGYKVIEIGVPRNSVLSIKYAEDSFTFVSDVLECVYLETMVYFNYKFQFNLCSNLKKIIYTGNRPLPSASKQSDYFDYFNLRKYGGLPILCNLLNDGERIRNNALYQEANVVYKLNYETTGRDFYDLDSTLGSLIKPQDPTREGYTFKGWYTEPECINEWDFENDEVTKYSKYIEINEEDGETKKYSVIVKTYLYAKWEEIKEA